MKTEFTLTQLTDPDLSRANEILRQCVHCGFCNATCPTFRLTGDERDGPRGRIYLMKQYLETGGENHDTTMRHIDRCLSCLSCETTCPSGVDYGQLVDLTREKLESARALSVNRFHRWWLGAVIPRPSMFRLAEVVGELFQPAALHLPGIVKRLASQLPRKKIKKSELDKAQIFRAKGGIKYRVALHPGCVQKVIDPEITRATIRLLTRHGCEVIVPEGFPCCGSLNLHLGQKDRATSLARRNVEIYTDVMKRTRIEAILSTTSGCGVTLKDYADILKDETNLRNAAVDVAEKVMDVGEFLLRLDLEVAESSEPLRVAYQAPCSLQHGQGVRDVHQKLLARCGYEVLEPKDAHICCGSAGVYSFLQGDLADQMRSEKVQNLRELGAHVITSANIGCMNHLAPDLTVRIFHTVQLLDWATGGPRPL